MPAALDHQERMLKRYAWYIGILAGIWIGFMIAAISTVLFIVGRMTGTW